MTSEPEAAVAAIRRGGLVVVPTDTVYGLACDPHRPEPSRRLYALKGRDERKPTALVAASVDLLLECVPELRGRAETIARAVLPGALTLVLPNPAQRFGWLAGHRPDALGVRVPDLAGVGRAVLEQVGVLAATSANRAGGSDPRRLEDVPEDVLAGVDAVVDGGELPGIPSTVLDFTGVEPTVIREGAVPAGEALQRAEAALAGT
jgi:L-threonylcarbamoyladenylate synthase